MDRDSRLERPMSDLPAVTRLGPGTYRVETPDETHIVSVAGPSHDRWVHWNGHVFRRPFTNSEGAAARRSSGHAESQALTSPMPATVLKVLAKPGAAVRKHDTLIILEAMKMELPVRAVADGVVRAVLCVEGTLVQAGATLIEFES